MKRVALIFVLTLLLGNLNAFSQIDLGVIGGLHYTTHVVEPDVSFEEKSRAEYGFGLLLNIPFQKSLSVQVQAMYLRKGSDIAIPILQLNEDVKIVGENIELPVMLRYTFDTGKVKPYYMIGPSVSYLLSAKQTASYIPADQEDVKEDTKSIEFSIVMGGGIQIVLEKVSLYAQLKYLHGITNVDDVEEEGDHSESIYSRGLSLMAGLTIPIGGK